MKKGSAGDDVLGLDDEGDGDNEDDDADVDDEPDVETEEPLLEESTPTVDTEDTGATGLEIPQTTAEDGGVPWVYTRSNVKQDRDMVQFYLRKFVQDAEVDLVDAVESELGADVSKTDVREAAYLAAMRDPEIVAKELERWGFEGE